MGRQLRAIGLLPGIGTVVVPGLILLLGDFDIGWGLAGALAAIPVLAGAALIATGLALMYRTISLFAHAGKGTLAPWDATRKLVVHGPYRFVRNPMITGVLTVLLGEAGLRERFGDDYEVYRRNVPRWVPRRTPWHTDRP